MLLVCGQGQDRHFWQGFSQALMATAPGRWRPIALDPRGIGDSDPLPPADAAIVTWSGSDDAPYYCVEPWMGPPNAPGTQTGLHWVQPGKMGRFVVEVAVL